MNHAPKRVQCYFPVNLTFLVVCRANAGVTSDAESVTESLRRSRQLMVQVRNEGIVHLHLLCIFGFLIYKQKLNCLIKIVSLDLLDYRRSKEVQTLSWLLVCHS